MDYTEMHEHFHIEITVTTVINTGSWLWILCPRKLFTRFVRATCYPENTGARTSTMTNILLWYRIQSFISICVSGKYHIYNDINIYIYKLIYFSFPETLKFFAHRQQHWNIEIVSVNKYYPSIKEQKISFKVQ